MCCKFSEACEGVAQSLFVPWNSVAQERPTKMCQASVSHNSVLYARESHKGIMQDCQARVSFRSLAQECLTSVQRSPQERCARLSFKNVKQECHTNLCLTRMSRCKSVKQGCQTSFYLTTVSCKCVTQETVKQKSQMV